jgi:hypothetical protein
LRVLTSEFLFDAGACLLFAEPIALSEVAEMRLGICGQDSARERECDVAGEICARFLVRLRDEVVIDLPPLLRIEQLHASFHEVTRGFVDAAARAAG